MLIATFNAATGWAGKSITYDEERFTLEGHASITVGDVIHYDRQGYLQWATDDLRKWAHELEDNRHRRRPQGQPNLTPLPRPPF